jgi:hypothetical protein
MQRPPATVLGHDHVTFECHHHDDRPEPFRSYGSGRSREGLSGRQDWSGSTSQLDERLAMKQHTPILDLTLHSARFRTSFVNHIDRVIAELPPGDNARQIEAMMTEQRTGALTALRNHLSQVEIEDARLFQLAEVARSAPGVSGWAHRQDFQPSVTQRQILGALGRGGEVKDLDRVIGLMISGGVADVLRAHAERYADMERRISEANAGRREAEQKAEPLAQTQADLATAQRRIANLEDEVALRERQLSDAQAFVTGPGSERPRRVHVTGETGIYTTVVDGETRYEIGYSDAEGKQRWRRLGPDESVEEARQLRRRLAGQSHKSDRADDDTAAAGDGDDDKQTTTEPVAAGTEA